MLDEHIKSRNNALRNYLGAKIVDLLDAQDMNQTEIAALLKMNQPRVSVLIDRQFESFRIDTLVNYLLRLGANIDISIS